MKLVIGWRDMFMNQMKIFTHTVVSWSLSSRACVTTPPKKLVNSLEKKLKPNLDINLIKAGKKTERKYK